MMRLFRSTSLRLFFALSSAFCPPLAAAGRAQPPPTAPEKRDRAGEAAGLAAQGRALLASDAEKAQALYEKALPLYREIGDRAGEAQCLLSLGNCAARRRQTPLALERFEAARKLYQEINDFGGQALALWTTGSVYQDSGQAGRAMPCFEQSAALFARANDPKRQAKALVSLSRAYLEQRDAANGLKYLEQARPLSEAAGDRDTETVILFNLAGIYAYQNDYHKAIAAYQQVLPLLEADGNKGRIASCCNNLGLLTWRVGDFLKSLEYLTRAVALAQDAGDSAALATAQDHLAADYAYLGQQDAALEWELKSLQASEASGSLRLKADAYINLARIYGQMSRRPDEGRAAERALALYRQADDEQGAAFALHALATNRLAVGDREMAAARESQSRALFEKTNDLQGMAATWLQSGDLAQESDPAKAEADYQKAYALCQRLGYPYGEETALARLGELSERRGRRAEAAAFYRQALLRQETLRGSLGGLTETKSHFQAEKFPLYPRYIGLLLQGNQNEQAFEWTQRAKGRALVDLMDAANANAAPPLTAKERAQQAEWERRGAAVTGRWLASLAERGETRQARPDALRQQRAARQARETLRDQQILEQEWGAWREQILLRHPASAAAPPARAVSLAEIAAVLPADTALLEYVVFRAGTGKAEREQIALFVVTQRAGRPRLRLFTLKADCAELERKTREFRAACAARPGSAAEGPYKSLAHDLYGLIIAPAEPALTGVRRLALCPDGPLWNAPFQALLTSASGASGKGAEFLWERYALVTEYSATGWRAALGLRERAKRPAPSQTLLVMADPDFGPEDAAPSPLDLTLRGRAFRPLPYTRAEADALRAAFPDAVARTGAAAQESDFKQIASHFRYIHFATHAIFNEAAPMLSGVALARPRRGEAEDGWLTARELCDLRLAADMIVFSACETGRGRERRGEGLIGLTWAAFAAGVPAQVASQWAVDDAATARLMGAFYAGLKQGRAKDAALRGAALALLRDGKHAHPFYWSPFFLMGDWRGPGR